MQNPYYSYLVFTDVIDLYIRPAGYKFVFLFSTMTRRRQNTILVKVPGPEESQEEQESGSEASDSVSNGGYSTNTQNGQNVTLITLNSEGMTSQWVLTQKNISMLMLLFPRSLSVYRNGHINSPGGQCAVYLIKYIPSKSRVYWLCSHMFVYIYTILLVLNLCMHWFDWF